MVGGSTLTMQLARRLFLTPEKRWRRKIEESLLAVQLEKNYTKQQILSLYCNVVYLGQGGYGMQAAAGTYFGKRAAELSVAEAATLAGIVQLPTTYNPYRAPEKVTERRNYVLRRMLEEGFISQAVHDEAAASPLEVQALEPRALFAPYFAEDVRQHLAERYGEDEVLNGGLQVETTLDPRIQQATEVAMRRGLSRFDRRKGWRGAADHLEGDLGEARLPSWDRGRLEDGDWVEGIVLSVDRNGAEIRVGAETLTLEPRGVTWRMRGSRRPMKLTDLEVGDVSWFRLEPGEEDDEPHLVLEQAPEIEGAAVVVESATGAVRGMVGGWSYDRSKFNRVTQAKRQVGSAFKPFVFGAALETGFTPADTLLDAPVVFLGADNKPSYSPRNYYRKYYGIVTLRRMLELSINVSSVKLLDLVGVESVIDFARRSGVRSELPPYPSLALGSADMTPLELAAAYAAIANEGTYVEPYLIESVSTPDGRELERNRLRAQKAMEPEVAYVLSHMLSRRHRPRHRQAGRQARRRPRRQDRHHQRLHRRLVRGLHAALHRARLGRLQHQAQPRGQHDRRRGGTTDLARDHRARTRGRLDRTGRTLPPAGRDRDGCLSITPPACSSRVNRRWSSKRPSSRAPSRPRTCSRNGARSSPSPGTSRRPSTSPRAARRCPTRSTTGSW